VTLRRNKAGVSGRGARKSTPRRSTPRRSTPRRPTPHLAVVSSTFGFIKINDLLTYNRLGRTWACELPADFPEVVAGNCLTGQIAMYGRAGSVWLPLNRAAEAVKFADIDLSERFVFTYEPGLCARYGDRVVALKFRRMSKTELCLRSWT
jgi:hypothetical protein